MQKFTVLREFAGKVCVVLTAAVIAVIFAGCSLFSPNLDSNYGQVVATVDGTDIKITKKDLYDVYVSWGYYYVQNGQSAQETMDMLVDYLVDREISAIIAERKFGALTLQEKNQAKKSAYDSVNESLKTYVNEILGIEEETSDSTEESKVEYTPYEKYIEVSGNRDLFTLNLEKYETVEEVGYVDSKWVPDFPGVASDKAARQAMARIVRNLQTRESGFEKLEKSLNDFPEDDRLLKTDNPFIKALSDAEQAALNRELVRLVEQNEKSIMIGRLEECFELGIEGWGIEGRPSGETADNPADFLAYLNRGGNIDAFKAGINKLGTVYEGTPYEQPVGSGVGIATGIANNVAEQYKEKVKTAISNYIYNTPEDMEADLISSIDGVYYVPSEIADKLFTVSHILVGFTDEQKAKYTEINSEKESNPSYDADTALANLYAEVSSNGKNVYDIYNEVKKSINAQSGLQDKYTAFRDLIYKYNTDSGMQNPTYEYVMSVNESKNKMIESFTKASIELKNKGTKGAVSGIVWGEYGAHIIMYTRDIADFIWTADKTLLDRDYGNTLFATQTSYGNKTTFDVLAEGLKRSYSNYETAIVKQYKSEHKVTVIKSAFADMLD
jgi:hypothetical protein